MRLATHTFLRVRGHGHGPGTPRILSVGSRGLDSNSEQSAASFRVGVA